jgi:hypothetical protein
MQGLNNEQRKQWFTFENGLKRLNRDFMITRGRALLLRQTIEFYKNNTEALPPSFQWDKIQSYQKAFKQFSNQVRALNYAYSLTQSGFAALVPSSVFPGDLDLVADREQLSEQQIQAATFNRVDFFKDSELGIAPLIPLLIKGAIVLGGALVVLGVTNSITESSLKQKKLDLAIVKAQSQIEFDMKDDPQIFRMWTDYKAKTLKTVKAGFLESIGGGGLGIAGVGLAIIVGFIIFQKVSGGRK